jgi:hypothetical protein
VDLTILFEEFVCPITRERCRDSGSSKYPKLSLTGSVCVSAEGREGRDLSVADSVARYFCVHKSLIKSLQIQ